MRSKFKNRNGTSKRLSNHRLKKNSLDKTDRKKRDELKISNLLGASILTVFIVNSRFFIQKLFFGTIPAETISIIVKIIYVTYFIYTLPSIFRRTNNKTLAILSSSTIIIVLGFILFKENNLYFKETVIDFVTLCLPPMIVASQIKDFSILRKQLVKISRLVCASSSIYLIFLGNTTTLEISNRSYELGLGYSMLIPILILLWETIKNKNAIDITIVILSILFLILHASRGPLIAIALFIVYFSVKHLLNNNKKISAIIITLLFILISINFGAIAKQMATASVNLGYNSRTLTLLSAETLHDSGRDVMYEKVLNEIKKEPLSIRGINADYSLLGIYSHNLFLELLYEFGIIIGGILSLTIILLVIKTFINTHGNDKEIIALIFMVAGISSLLVSSTLWCKVEFWIWLAMIDPLKHNYNREKQ